MQQKAIITIIILIAIVIGAYFFFVNDASAPRNDQNTADNAAMDEESTDNDTDTGTEGDDDVVEVTHTTDGFSPETVEVSVGDTVRWKSDTDNMWVATDVHPSHTVYSGTSLGDHCPDTDGNDFDQCETSNTYTFTFEQAGEWKYHNHVQSSQAGTVIVTEN